MNTVLLLLLVAIAVFAMTEGKPCGSLCSQFGENIRKRRKIEISSGSVSSEEESDSASIDTSDEISSSSWTASTASSSSSSSEEDTIVNKSKRCINDPPANKKWEHLKRKVMCEGYLKVKKQAKIIFGIKGY